jgi:hypothetical protein
LVQADLIDTRALIEGPIGKNWSFIAAGRRSWIDAWIGPVLEQAGAGVTTAPVYYDFQFVAETKPSSSSRLSLRSYGSNDRLEILIRNPAANEPGVSGNVGLETGFYQFQALYEDQLSPKVSQRSMVSVGRTQLRFNLSSLAFNIDLYPVAMRNEFAFKVARGATLNTGMDFQVAPFDVYVRAPPPPREGEPDPGPFVSRPPLEQRTGSTAWRPGWYLEGELTPTRKLRIVPGARVDYARDTGRMDFSPRINARYDIVSPTDGTMSDAEAWANGTRKLRTTIKGGVGLFHQPPQFQETDKVFGTPLLRSNRSLHAAVGFEQEFTRYIELGMEAYYKDYSRQVSSLPNAAGSFGYDNAGFGRGYGLETLLKYKPDQRFFGWVAYTLSRSLRTQREGEPERLFQFDQTHNLTMLGSYRLGRGWEIGARFRIISGSLFTPNLSAPSLTALYAADAGSYVPITGDPFSRRLPLFHQLDVRVDKRWQFRTWRLNAYLDVQNAYNNAQVQGFDYNYNFSQRVSQSGLPIIPSLGLRGEM